MAEQEIKPPSVPVFAPLPIEFSDDFDRIRKAIIINSCHQTITGVTPTILRDKLVTLLAVYIQRGYNKESKRFAEDVVNVDKAAIASMNLELRRAKLMYKDPMNVRINNLSRNIEKLRDYLEQESPDRGLMLLRLERGTK